MWHYEPAIQLVVDLGVLEDFPTNLIPGFTEGLLGATKGSRVAFTIPPAKGFGEQGNTQLGIAGN